MENAVSELMGRDKEKARPGDTRDDASGGGGEVP